MPVYVYRIMGKEPATTFEIRQSIHAPALTHHPETGEPVERVILAPRIGRPLGDSDIRNSGLKKYTRTADGSYEGPDGIIGGGE